MKIKIKKLLRESFEASKLKTIMQKYNIETGKVLGKGQYGTVYYGVSDDYGPVAIKMLDKTQLSTKREVENYDRVNKARSQSKNIAKHFQFSEKNGVLAFLSLLVQNVTSGENICKRLPASTSAAVHMAGADSEQLTQLSMGTGFHYTLYHSPAKTIRSEGFSFILINFLYVGVFSINLIENV